MGEPNETAGGRQREKARACDRLRLTTHKPAYPLSLYVERIWHMSHSGLLLQKQRVYPNGSIALVVNLHKPVATYFVDGVAFSVRGPLIAGPYSRSFEIGTAAPAATIGAEFRPGTARMFFPMAAHELHNTDVSLFDVWPAEADCLLNELYSRSGVQDQLRFVEQYLSRKLSEARRIPPSIQYSVEELIRYGGVRRISQIQRQSGLSHTRHIQLFKEHVGLSPKLFCRVRRFHAVLDSARKNKYVNWANLALDGGYYDQAHLIRDFRAFAGITPLDFEREFNQSSTREPQFASS